MYNRKEQPSPNGYGGHGQSMVLISYYAKASKNLSIEDRRKLAVFFEVLIRVHERYKKTRN